MKHIIVVKDTKGSIILPAWQVDSATLQIMLFESVFIYNEHIYTISSRETRLVSDVIDNTLPLPTTESHLHITLFVKEGGKRCESNEDF